MQGGENAVWQAFRRANAPLLVSLYFNVACGSVPGWSPDQPEGEQRDRAAIWSKKVDVIAETTAEPWLIEVKLAARASSVGQILQYVPLVAARRQAWATCRPILIAGSFDPDALALCGTLGVECYAPPFSQLKPRPSPGS